MEPRQGETSAKQYRNILKGAELEDSVHDAFSQSGYNVESHKITDNGADLKAFNDREFVIAECLNWYGGYIHPLRWLSIVDNLLSYPSATTYLICVGVHPTEDQCEELLNLRVNLVHGDTVAQCTRNLKNHIKGVISTEPEEPVESVSSSLEEPVSSSYSFSSYNEAELDYWNSLASEVFS